MAINIEAIIYYLILADAVIDNIMVWFIPSSVKWYKKKWPGFSKHFPLTRGWIFFYLVLVLWIGYALYRLGVLPY